MQTSSPVQATFHALLLLGNAGQLHNCLLKLIGYEVRLPAQRGELP